MPINRKTDKLWHSHMMEHYSAIKKIFTLDAHTMDKSH